MKPRSSAIILAIALALAAAYWLVERPRHRRAAERARAGRALVSFSIAEASDIVIARHEAVLAFTMRDTHWEMTSPLRDGADPGVLGALLGALVQAEVERDLGAASDDARYGLTPPEASILVTNAEGDTLAHLAVGRTTVDHAWAYARRAGERDVLLVPTTVRRYANLAVEDYRNKRPITFDLDVVTGFAVRGPGGETQWWRDGDTGWRGTSAGDTVAGDAAAVEAVLRRLRAARALRFLDPPRAGAVMGRARHGVEVFKRPPHPALHIAVLLTDSASAFTQLSSETRAVEVDSAVAAVFRATPGALRERRVLRFDPAAVHRLEVVTPDTAATLVRAGERWTPLNPSLEPVGNARVRALVDAALALRFARIDPRPAAGTEGEPAFGLVVRGAGGTLLDEMTCRPSGPARYRARSKSSGLSGEIDAAQLGALAAAARRLRP